MSRLKLPPPRFITPPVPPNERYVGCDLGSHCSLSHYWMSREYTGEVCCIPKPCLFLRKAEAAIQNERLSSGGSK